MAEQKSAVEVDAEVRTPDGLRREFIVSGADEAAERVRTYAATADADKVALLRQWSDEAGKHRPALLRDLAAAQLLASAQLLLRHADNPRLRAVLDRTFAAEGQGYRELTRDLSDEDAAALRREVVARLFGNQTDDGRPAFADRIVADAEDIGVDDADSDDDRDDGSDNLLVLAAAGADGEDDGGDDDGRLVLSEADNAELSRQLADIEFAASIDAARYAPVGRAVAPGIRRFYQDFNRPDVNDETFDLAARKAGFDPERARLFRDMLNVDDESIDAVADRISTVFADSHLTEQFLLGTLGRINATDGEEERLRHLWAHYKLLRRDDRREAFEKTIGGTAAGIASTRFPRSPSGGRGSGGVTTPTLRIQRFKKTPGKNEAQRLSAIRPSTRGQPKDMFQQRAEDVLKATNPMPVSPEENVRRGLAAFDKALMEKLTGGRGVVAQAMFRSDFGPVAFFWGKPGNHKFRYDDGNGLSKIVAKHGIEVIEKIVNAIARGKVRRWYDRGTKSERVEIEYEGVLVVLNRYHHNDRKTWLLTGYEIGNPILVDKPFDLNALTGPVFFKGR